MLSAAPHLTSALDGIRLTLHVLAATVWVGGQITMLGLVGPSRALGEAAPRTLARAFNRLAWPAYGLLFVTGIWNIQAVGKGGSTWNMVLGIKMTFFLLAGLGAYLHTKATSKAQLAIWGSVGGVASVIARCLGVFLAG